MKTIGSFLPVIWHDAPANVRHSVWAVAAFAKSAGKEIGCPCPHRLLAISACSVSLTKSKGNFDLATIDSSQLTGLDFQKIRMTSFMCRTEDIISVHHIPTPDLPAFQDLLNEAAGPDAHCHAHPGTSDKLISTCLDGYHLAQPSLVTG